MSLPSEEILRIFTKSLHDAYILMWLGKYEDAYDIIRGIEERFSNIFKLVKELKDIIKHISIENKNKLLMEFLERGEFPSRFMFNKELRRRFLKDLEVTLSSLGDYRYRFAVSLLPLVSSIQYLERRLKTFEDLLVKEVYETDNYVFSIRLVSHDNYEVRIAWTVTPREELNESSLRSSIESLSIKAELIDLILLESSKTSRSYKITFRFQGALMVCIFTWNQEIGFMQVSVYEEGKISSVEKISPIIEQGIKAILESLYI
ncbi:MAG: hypothetical protein NDF54_08005 [archaeon GB-1867-035]|nr:hypothetical protein [Candidatus Culexmicrobium profundum]